MPHTILSSPLGDILLLGEDCRLTGLHFLSVPQPMQPPAGSVAAPDSFSETMRQLKDYFAGKLKNFSIPLSPEGTNFQKKVWEALYAIPYGTTISYGTLAARIGNPKASRAVGGANGRNPIPIIIPCHRVINSNGSLGGYSCGLEIKKYLLNLETKYS